MSAPAPLPALEPARLVGVQFRRAATIVYDFLAGELELPHDSRVVVETEHGESLGWTVGEPSQREPHLEGEPLRRVMRLANPDDLEKEKNYAEREREAVRFCALRARQTGLDMKVVAAEWQHSGGRVVVYFSSESRVDFRGLVRELAQKFKARVEMRQVGARDEAKIIGAMGPCGRETCCTSWLRAFAPVTIKMAKDQGLALNPQKTMGVCGRLLCCLAYEQDTYTALRKALPRVGKQVQTPQGPGRIIDVLTLRGAVRVALDAGGPWLEVPASEVSPVGARPPEAAPVPETPAPEAKRPPRPEPKPRPEQRKPEEKKPRPEQKKPEERKPRPEPKKPEPRPATEGVEGAESEPREGGARHKRRRGRGRGEPRGPESAKNEPAKNESKKESSAAAAAPQKAEGEGGGVAKKKKRRRGRGRGQGSGAPGEGQGENE